MELLLSTPHGSRLYGLHHANSDHDRFEVYGWSKFRSKQSIAGSDDLVKTSLDRFLAYCDKGVPQYLEAMFSTKCTVNKIEEITSTYHPNMLNARQTYYRTIGNFWLEGSFKRRRHAMRLMLNLRSMLECGRFDPTLTPDQIEWVNRMAESDYLPDFL